MSEDEGVRERVHLRITGRVQGVFYRASVLDRARALGLGGWVRNCSDQSVEAVAEGPAAMIRDLITYCREGPPLARVRDIVVTSEPPEGLDSFTIRG